MVTVTMKRITTDTEIIVALQSHPDAELYLARDGTWQCARFGAYHEITPGLVKRMHAAGRLVKRWPEKDASPLILAKTDSR